MLTYLLRFLLFWWILTVLFKWIGRWIAPPRDSSKVTDRAGGGKEPDVVHSGKIEDAEFEEMDDR